MKTYQLNSEVDTPYGSRAVRISAAGEQYLDTAMEIAVAGMPDDAEIIYKGRNRVFKLTRNGEELCVKAFRRPNFFNSYIYTNVRESKARRSFDNANTLLDNGIGTPEPKAWVECKSNGRLKESYYISKYIPTENMRQWEEKPDSDTLLREFAREMVKFHNAGIYHKDFSPGNALYTASGDGHYKFYFVDLNRMEFGVRKRKKLMRNFRAINLLEDETARLARIYAAEAGIDPEAAAREAIVNLNVYKASKARHRALKRIFKRSRK